MSVSSPGGGRAMALPMRRLRFSPLALGLLAAACAAPEPAAPRCPPPAPAAPAAVAPAAGGPSPETL
ncbi:MAG TPA: hypothetical protein VFS00_32175, partial [Polyangiaceae bacterium]|nr:hypothetical protein [Polyangiaceae bacterium]